MFWSVLATGCITFLIMILLHQIYNHFEATLPAATLLFPEHKYDDISKIVGVLEREKEKEEKEREKEKEEKEKEKENHLSPSMKDELKSFLVGLESNRSTGF